LPSAHLHRNTDERSGQHTFVLTPPPQSVLCSTRALGPSPRRAKARHSSQKFSPPVST
jgi:hypothetical protein